MARTYDAGSPLPLPVSLWDFTLSSTATPKEFNQTSGPYSSSVPQPLFRPPTDGFPQYLDPTFEPSHTLVSYPPFEVSDYQQIDVSGWVPHDISSSGAHHPTNRPIHGFSQPNLRLISPGLPYRYEGFSREYQNLRDDTDVSSLGPYNPSMGLDVISHAEGSFFAGDTSGGLMSYVDSSWSCNVFDDDIFADFYGIEPTLTLMENTDTSTTESSPNSSLEFSPPSLGTSSPQARFACHHPQCGGRTFSRRSDRDRHARVHDDARQYACLNESCVKKFYRKDKLQSHLKRAH